jgi:hypothetical protein
MDLCREGDIYKPCKWTIPDAEVADKREKVTCEATDKKSLRRSADPNMNSRVSAHKQHLSDNGSCGWIIRNFTK